MAVTEHMLSYVCPKCKTEFRMNCIFVQTLEEYQAVREKLIRPFSSDPDKHVCFKQMDCPNEKCDEKRQFPVLIFGALSA